MSRTTFQNALTELYALLADTYGVPVASLVTAGAAKVYPHEPGSSGWVKPCSVTLSPAGLEPTEWLVSVRVYVDASALPPATAQDLLIDVTVAVDILLKAGAAFGPSRWSFGYVADLDCWVALSEIQIGREDGF